MRTSVWLLLLGLEVVLAGSLLWRPTLDAPLSTSAIRHHGGYQYSVDIPLTAPAGYQLLADSNDHPAQSSLLLLQDGVPVGAPHSVHDLIRTQGGGAYSHWISVLYFSTPNNTDPRGDGHAYAVRAQAVLAPPVQSGLLAGAVVVALPLFYFSLFWLRRRAHVLVAPLKVAALGLVYVAAPWGWFPLAWREVELLSSAGRWPLLALYLAVAGAALVGLMLLPFVRDWRIRVPLGILLLLGLAVDQFTLALSGQHMTLDLMQTVWRERSMAPTVLTAYSTTVARSGLLLVIVAAPIVLPPPQRYSVRARVGIVPLVALVAVAAIIFSTRGRTEAFPSPFAVPAQFVVTQVLSDFDPNVVRDPVEYARPVRPQFRRIVMVVDESVRGDYLGLNNPRYDNTPTLDNAGPSLVNYGVAISAANCSVAARLIMRVGLRREQLPDTSEIWRRLPTIWQYAKTAGFRTALVDAWRAEGDFHSYMDAQEASRIDITRSALTGPEYARDFMVADLVAELLTRDEPMFIYVNKNGTHQDYAHQFPPTLDYDPSRLVAGLPLDEQRREAVKNYHKALRSSVDGFFARLLPALQRDDTILLYTSDHGQSLFEGGYDLSHCSLTANLHLGEVLVPMFVITQAPEAQARFRREAERAFNRASHYEVMPTLLQLLGYADSWVEPLYGPGLLNVPIDRRRGFLMGTFFHPAAVWIDAE